LVEPIAKKNVAVFAHYVAVRIIMFTDRGFVYKCI